MLFLCVTLLQEVYCEDRGPPSESADPALRQRPVPGIATAGDGAPAVVGGTPAAAA